MIFVTEFLLMVIGLTTINPIRAGGTSASKTGLCEIVLNDTAIGYHKILPNFDLVREAGQTVFSWKFYDDSTKDGDEKRNLNLVLFKDNTTNEESMDFQCVIKPLKVGGTAKYFLKSNKVEDSAQVKIDGTGKEIARFTCDKIGYDSNPGSSGTPHL